MPRRVDEVRRIFLHPDVTDAFDVQPAEPDLDGIVRFLCDEREFSRERVERRARAHVSRALAVVNTLTAETAENRRECFLCDARRSLRLDG